MKNVADARLETKDEAFKNFKETLNDRAYVLEGLEGEDFLRSSISVSLEDIRNSKSVVKAIQKIKGVEEVRDRQDIVQKVIRFTNIVKNGSAVAMLILLVVAIFIIQNTIKLSVYAREEEIHIMKFVGATDHFIRMPFMIEGIMIGTLAFLVSATVIVLGYNAVISSVSNIISMFEFLQLEKCVIPLAVCMGVFGILMGALGSALSLKRHLKV
jgi:cell division transport system permease protein